MDHQLRAKSIDGVIAATAHPGVTDTNLFEEPAQNGFAAKMAMKVFSAQPVGQKAEMGALPTLYAATAAGVKGGGYYGPSGFKSFWGYPVLEEPVNNSKSKEAGAKLWQVSERLTELPFVAGEPSLAS